MSRSCLKSCHPVYLLNLSFGDLMNTSDEIDPNSLALDVSFNPVGASPRPRRYEPDNTTRINEPFIFGPLPVRWFKEAYMAGKAAFAITPALWFYRGLKGGDFNLNLSRLRLQWGISRQTAGRGLKELENASLIQVVRVNGRKSKIKMFKTELRRTPKNQPNVT